MLNKKLRRFTVPDNTADFAVISSFSRSFDSSHIENNRIHLISSIFLLKGSQVNYLENYCIKVLSEDKKKYVFILTPDLEEYLHLGPQFIEKGVLKIIQCNISYFLKNLLFTVNSDSFFETVFGDLDLNSKDFNTISQQSIFVFYNQM